MTDIKTRVFVVKKDQRELEVNSSGQENVYYVPELMVAVYGSESIFASCSRYDLMKG